MFLNGGKDSLLALLQLAQVGRALLDSAQLGIIQPARSFLAVAGNKRNGIAFCYELECGGNERFLDAQLAGDGGCDVHKTSS